MATMKILAFHNYANHDSGAAVITDERGKLEYVTISEERLSRVKYSYFFPLRAIDYCMEQFGIKKLRDFDIVISDYSFRRQFLNTNYRYRKLETDYLKTVLDLDYKKVIYGDHHDAHAASAFYPSGFDDAAVLIVDGLGSEGNTCSLYTASKSGGLKLLDRSYGMGIGLVYTLVTQDILNFGTGEEGKTMGLSALGAQARHKRVLDFRSRYKGLDADYSSFIWRNPSGAFKMHYPRCKDPKKDVTNDYYARVAYDVQEETEKYMLHLARYAFEKTGKKKLCIAGGVALNCVANDRIVNEGPFEEVFVQPASSDTGIPLGLALWAYKDREKQKHDISFVNAFTGKNYNTKKSEALLKKYNIPYHKSSAAEVAKLISQKNIVGWHIENSEFGPRALGHRSILADARYPDMKDILNAKVKHREMFRPFAPSILEEKANDYFVMKAKSPFMLLAPMVRKDKLDKVPSIVHVDGSARVQTAGNDDNPKYYELITEFEKITGVPLVLNTSFNDNGEPVVETPLDSLICFLRTKMDYLYIDGLLVQKSKVKGVAASLKKLIAIRAKMLKDGYRSALKRLAPRYSSNEMKAFLKAYYPMHQYYARIHPVLKLQEALNTFTGGKIVTDAHHYEVIKTALPEEFARSKNDIVVVEDEFKSLSKIADGSLVILFNASLYLPNGKKVINFYEDLSMPLVHPPFEEVKGGDLELSNEYRGSKDWDGFYNEVLK